MKKIIIFLILSYTFAFAQDKEPNPWHFEWGYSSTKRPFVLDSFPQTSFLTGFQWSGSAKMNNALGNNAVANKGYIADPTDAVTPINWIFQPSWLDRNGYRPGYFGAVMMQYEPTLPINDYNKGRILRPLDDADPIFGFKNRKGKILNDPMDPNYSRLILYKDSSYTNSIVLSDIWPQPNFYTAEWGEKGGGQTDNYLGRKWYLAINLKRLNPITDVTKDDDVVLKIKMPYKTWENIDSSIKFNKVPINSAFTTEELYFMHPDSAYKYPFIDSRGYAQLMHIDTTTTIEITRKMIPVSTDPSENITIYAEFHTNSHPNANPKFSPKLINPKYIKEFDIQVEYVGNLDIAIDWIRVEEVKGHLLMRGELDWKLPPDANHKDGRGKDWYWTNDKDSTYDYIKVGDIIVDSILVARKEEINDIYNIVESSLESFKSKSNTWEDAKLFRFYFQDIEVDRYYWWGTIRYCNKFTNGLYITSDVPHYPEIYEYYTESPNRYFGNKYSQNEHSMGNPIMRSTKTEESDEDSVRASESWSVLGYHYGFNGGQWKDTLTSGYETFFVNWKLSVSPTIYNDIKNFSDKDYLIGLDGSNSFQSEWARTKYFHYFDPLRYKYLYSEKGWFSNLFIGSKLKLNPVAPLLVNNTSNLAAQFEHVRPKTGEEIRLIFNNEIIMGAKGILFDREEAEAIVYYVDTTLKSNGLTGLGDGNKNAYYSNDNNYYNFIESDTLGSDFTGGIGDIYNFKNVINKDSIVKYGLISEDRIYTGVKSTRLEMKKLIDWVRLNDNELMGLRLQATYAKGFKTFQNWNPYKFNFWNTNPLKKILNLEGIRTRKLYEPKHTMVHNTNPSYESQDSSFFDLTLLQHKSASAYDLVSKKKPIYLGLLNRRTDPLIYRDSISSFNGDSLRELMFFTSAEFDDKVRHGGTDLWGVNQDSTWWQQQWWKRLGIREVNIPLQIEPYGNGTYILAEEIGLINLSTLGWRYNDKYYHKVDTILNYNDSLKAKLLPGQGKIIKISYVPYFFNDPTEDSIPGNDSCYFCDIFNDFDLFEFEIVKDPPLVGSGCCYNVTLKYNGNCTFDNIPFRLIFEGKTGNSFISDDPMMPLLDSLGTNIKFKNLILNLDSTSGTISLGKFCIDNDTNDYKISILAGKDKDGKFIGCDRELQFKTKCGSLEDPKDCCEDLAVSHIFLKDLVSNLYCTTWQLSPSFSTDCIYGITLANGPFTKVLIPKGPFPLSVGAMGTVCVPLAQCDPTNITGDSIIYITMKLLGKDGTVICEKEVPIYAPCANFDIFNNGDNEVLPPSGPYPKSTEDKPDSKTYESETFNVTIWPNPTSGELNVEIDSKLKTEVDINLTNNLGVGISNENGISLNKGKNEIFYNLDSYTSGVYYLQIKGKDGNIVLPIILNK